MKQNQKTWILELAKHEYERFVAERGKQPIHGSKKALIEQIYAGIAQRCIWIPYGEVLRVLNAKIAHWSRTTAIEKTPGEEKE